jgi:NAD(P)-dependent dehydrogenase (short-subunit alcohol dehydrogenase family)
MALTLTYPEGGMLVTGGTGSVGGGIVRALAKAGVPLVFTYRGNKEKAEAYESELRGEGAKVWAQAMDMADTGSIQAAMDRVVAECGGIHGLAIGAGPMVSFEKLMDFPVEEAVRFVNEDAMGYFRLFHAVTPLLRARGGGSITTCSTFANHRILVYDGISPLSKGSVEAMVRYVAAEEGPNNIRCNAVGIGWIQPGNQDFSQIPPRPDVEPEDQFGRMMVLMREIVDMTKIRRNGTPEDAGNLFAFLASNEASYLTGQIIAIDGGLSL